MPTHKRNSDKHHLRSGITSPLAYVGGKARLAPAIIDMLPQDRVCYVEVFGGAGHVITQKAAEPNEVYNDVQGVVVNFFLVLRDHRDELIRRIERMPYSREEHNRILEWWDAGCPGPTTDIERAARWFYLMKTGFSSKVGNQFAYGRGVNAGTRARTLARTPDRLDAMADRWREVHIERLDFADLIRRYDTRGVVFYCDPPYVGCEAYYEASGFTRADHARLADALGKVKARVILSYYPHELVDQLYPRNLWRRRSIAAVKHAARTAEPGIEKPRAVELVLTNFDPRTGRRLDE